MAEADPNQLQLMMFDNKSNLWKKYLLSYGVAGAGMEVLGQGGDTPYITRLLEYINNNHMLGTKTYQVRQEHANVASNPETGVYTLKGAFANANARVLSTHFFFLFRHHETGETANPQSTGFSSATPFSDYLRFFDRETGQVMHQGVVHNYHNSGIKSEPTLAGEIEPPPPAGGGTRRVKARKSKRGRRTITRMARRKSKVSRKRRNKTRRPRSNNRRRRTRKPRVRSGGNFKRR